MKIILSITFALVMTLLVGCGQTATVLPITPTITQQPSASARPTTLTPTATKTSLPNPPTRIPTSPTPTPPPVVASPSATEHARIEISPPQKLSGHSGELGSLAFSSDGTLLASTGEDGTIRLWDVASGQQKQVWQGGSASMKGLDFSHGGQLLVSMEEDSTIALWDVSSGQAVGRINPPGSTCGVEFSPDGAILASGHVDGVVRLWETGNWKLVRELSGLEALSCAVAFSPDGSRIAFRNALLNYELLSPSATELLLTGKVVMRENSGYAYGFMDRIVGGQRVVGIPAVRRAFAHFCTCTLKAGTPSRFCQILITGVF